MAAGTPDDVRMRGFRRRAAVEDVLAWIDAHTAPLEPQQVRLGVSREFAATPVISSLSLPTPLPSGERGRGEGAWSGRVLAADVIAPCDVPGFDRAAMDGYALRGDETVGAGTYNPLPLRIVGESLPGRPFGGTVQSGEAVRIMTGAAMPAGADAVLPAEHAAPSPPPLPAGERSRGEGDVVEALEAVPPGRHVGHRGEDIRAGTRVLQAGRRLRPQDLGVLASIGVAQVPVVRRPRVQLVITGDELLPVGSKPEGTKVVDSNSVMLAALVERDGGVVLQGPIVPDRRDAVRDAILGADADVILVSGGSSVGAEDHAPVIVAEHGELAFHGVAMRPSSPTGVGLLPPVRPQELPPLQRRGRGGSGAGRGDSETRAGVSSPPRPHTPSPPRLVFLLPGNPVSCLCAYDFFAGRAIRRLAGLPAGWPYVPVRAVLARKISSAVGRVDYARVRWTGERGQGLGARGHEGGARGQGLEARDADNADALLRSLSARLSACNSTLNRQLSCEPVSVSGASILSSTTRADGFVVVPADSEGYAAATEIVVFCYD